MARKRISDEMIAILVVILLVVSMVTLFPFLRMGITGYQTTPTSTAQANLTVESQVGCDFVDNRIDLGTGVQGEENTSEMVADWWILQNTGTENVTVNISDNGNWLFECVSCCGGSCAAETQYWQYRCNDATTQSGVCNTTISTYQDVKDDINTEVVLVGLEPDGANDNATFGTNATVPTGEAAGYKVGEILARCVLWIAP